MTTQENKHLIFVYGTLKKEGGNGAHDRHLKHAPLMGKCSIPGVMIHLGHYPGMVHDAYCRVTGEVYEVTTKDIHGMDAYEGTPHNYGRRLVETPFGRAWAYFKNHTPYPIPDGLVCVARGLWTGDTEGDKAPYSKVKDFYVNKRWNEPEYRAMEKQPITGGVSPESGMIGTWDDERKCFVYPNGATHAPPGLVHPVKQPWSTPAPEQAVWTWDKDRGVWFDQLGNTRKDNPGPSNVVPFVQPEKPVEAVIRGVELM